MRCRWEWLEDEVRFNNLAPARFATMSARRQDILETDIRWRIDHQDSTVDASKPREAFSPALE
jgi:hypothetical protein